MATGTLVWGSLALVCFKGCFSGLDGLLTDSGGGKSELQTIQEIARDSDLHIKYGQQTEEQKIKYKMLVLYEDGTLLQEGQTRGGSRADMVHDSTQLMETVLHSHVNTARTAAVCAASL